VDVLWEQCQEAGRRRIDLAATALTLVFLLPLAWMVWAKLGGTGTQTTSDLRLPLVWFYAVSAAGVTAAAVLAAVRLWALWRGALLTDLED
jgi:TRAP-type C4-dicarboxylate transport system permease small subunit